MRPSSTDQTALILRVPAEPADASAGWTPSSDDEPQAPEPLNNTRLTLLAWVLPFVAAFGLGLWKLATPGLSEDELATWGMVTVDWPHFVDIVRNVDATIAPYYLLLRGWAAVFGTTDIALRLPSVLFGAGAAGFVAAIGIRLAGRRVGLAAGLLLAVLPAFSRYAQDARPYALAMLAASMATYMLLRMVDRPRVGAYVAYASSLILLGLAHVVALLILVAHGFAVWQIRRSWRALFAWAAVALVVVLPAGPLLWLGAQQSGGQISWIPPISAARLADTPTQLFGSTIIAGAVIALALAGMSLRPPIRTVTLWAVAPVVALALASKVTPLWVARYMLFVLPAWALLASAALRRLTLLRGLVAVLGIAALSVPNQFDVRDVGGHGLASRDIAMVIRANRLPGDAVVFGPFGNGDQRVGRDALDRYLAPAERPVDKLMVRAPRTRGGLGAQECTDAQIPNCFGKPARVWVVRTGKLSDALQNIGPAKNQLLHQDFVQSETWQLKGLTVALFTRKPA
jgi:mannosyltransferase